MVSGLSKNLLHKRCSEKYTYVLCGIQYTLYSLYKPSISKSYLFLHWKPTDVIMLILSSQVALYFVIMTISNATGSNKLGIKTLSVFALAGCYRNWQKTFLSLGFSILMSISLVMSHEHHDISNHRQCKLFAQHLGQVNNKEKKLCITGSLWRESTGDLWIPLTKRQLCRKHFLCQNSCSKLGKKCCQSFCLESQIMNIKWKKMFLKIPGPPSKLVALGKRTGNN